MEQQDESVRNKETLERLCDVAAVFFQQVRDRRRRENNGGSGPWEGGQTCVCSAPKRAGNSHLWCQSYSQVGVIVVSLLVSCNHPRGEGQPFERAVAFSVQIEDSLRSLLLMPSLLPSPLISNMAKASLRSATSSSVKSRSAMMLLFID